MSKVKIILSAIGGIAFAALGFILGTKRSRNDDGSRNLDGIDSEQRKEAGNIKREGSRIERERESIERERDRLSEEDRLLDRDQQLLTELERRNKERESG